MEQITVRQDSPIYEVVKAAENIPKRGFVGVFIPAQIWDSDLSWMCKCLWGEIESLQRNEKYHACFASNDFLAKAMRSTAGSINNMISDLKKAGFVRQLPSRDRLRMLVAVHPDTPTGVINTPTGVTTIHPQVYPDYTHRCDIDSSIDTSVESREIQNSNITDFELNPDESIHSTTPTPKPKAKVSNKELLRYRICKLFGRKPTTVWSKEDERLLTLHKDFDLSDFDAIEEYYSHDGEQGYYTRKTVNTFLSHLADEVDKCNRGPSKSKDLSEYDLMAKLLTQ